MERELASIWEDVLGSLPPCVSSDFFDLGGDSLALLNLFAALEVRFGRRLGVEALAGGLTIAKLTQLLAADHGSRARTEPLVSLQPLGHHPAFFCVPGVGADVLHLHRLGVHMGTERPFYAFRWLPQSQLDESVSDIAARYVAAMLAIQPAGPFYIGGYCLGAFVAYEIAQQLGRKGHKIGMLAIIDQRRSRWQLTGRGVIPALYNVLVNTFGLFRENLSLDASRWIFRALGRRARKWSKATLGQRTDVVAAIEPSRLLQDQAPAPGEAHLPALRGYRAGSSSVPITLFRARDIALLSLPLDRTLGWGAINAGEVKVYRIPGDHISITTEPLVRQTAKALCDALNIAQGLSRVSARAVDSYPIGPSVRPEPM